MSQSDFTPVLFTWDWREQPDINAICSAVARTGGKWFEVETYSDEYGGVVGPKTWDQKDADNWFSEHRYDE